MRNVDKLRMVKVFELELTNMEGSPVYGISPQLTIGKEIGDLLISDPSISPRHCTFVLEQDVISLIDHGSVTGTFINRKKILPGRFVIMEETDTIHVGDLEIKIKVRNEAIPFDPDLPPLPEEAHKEVPEKRVEESSPADHLDVEDIPDRTLPPSRVRKAPRKKAISVYRGGNKQAANSLLRVSAIIGDVLISYGLYVILMPFDDFRSLLDVVPNTLDSLLGASLTTFWNAIAQDLGFAADLIKDFLSFFSNALHIGPVFLIFTVLRIVSTLILGVSLSEFFLSMRGRGNLLWKRLGGVLRVLVGVFTGPFLVFDLPAIISRRTFKEVLTFTSVYSTSTFGYILGLILFLPLTLGFALTSPLFQGFELEEAIAVNDKIDQRVKVKNAEQAEEVLVSSHFLGLDLSYNPEELLLIPTFKFLGIQKRLNYKTQVTFYFEDIQRAVNFELMKTFDLQQLLGIGFKGNFFLHDKFPEIHSFVYQTENPSFKVTSDKRSNNQFASEMIEFNKLSLGLNFKNAIEIMESYTPLIKGIIDYKKSLMALIGQEHGNVNEIGFVRIGNATFMRFSFLERKPFDLLIPLMKGQGRIYKVEFDKLDNLPAVSSKFYKFALDSSNWMEPKKQNIFDKLNSFQVVDHFGNMDDEDRTIRPDIAQALYGHYYETSAEVLKSNDQTQYEIWRSSVSSLFTLIGELSRSHVDIEAENINQKLFQNFQDLVNALENKNLEYFGIESSTTI
jgi:hypothetical protein